MCGASCNTAGACPSKKISSQGDDKKQQDKWHRNHDDVPHTWRSSCSLDSAMNISYISIIIHMNHMMSTDMTGCQSLNSDYK